MLQFIRAPIFLYVCVRRYQQFCTLVADSLRESRTAVREWECCTCVSFTRYINYGLGFAYRMLKTQKLNTLYGNERFEDCSISH